MNKVTTINLNGNAYQLEENGYEALRDYLDRAARRLKDNPDRDEILADIEQAIADKFRTILGAHKTVVVTREVVQIIAEMGPVEDDAAAETDPEADTAGTAGGGPTSPRSSASSSGERTPPPAAKRLYRVYEGAMISGVCNGVAAYLNVDVTIVRLAFAVLTIFTSGAGLLVYLLMALLVPSANTSAEKSAAYGTPFTAQEFIRRAKEGYYEGMKTFNDKRAHRAWKRKFRHEMRTWSAQFKQQMRENSHQWTRNWHDQWSQCRPPDIGASIALPILALLRALVAFIGIFAMISLLTTGAVFGIALPAGVPVWVGAIILLILYQIVAAPLKAMRRACLYSGPYGPPGHAPSLLIWDSLLWLGFLIVLIWAADRYVPQAHEALKNFAPALRPAWESTRDWWSTR